MKEKAGRPAEEKEELRQKVKRLRKRNAFSGTESWQNRFFFWADGSRETAFTAT